MRSLRGGEGPVVLVLDRRGLLHSDRAWIDDLRLPFQALRGYVDGSGGRGHPSAAREDPRGARRASPRSTARLLGTDEDREAFDGLVGLARKVYPFVENHNFYVEHWHHSMFWNKVRDLGRVFVAHGFFDDEEDIFYLHRNEIHSALYDLNIGWATGTEARGPTYWPPRSPRGADPRGARGWSRRPALGVPPEASPSRSRSCSGASPPRRSRTGSARRGRRRRAATGWPRPPGKAAGRARVVTDRRAAARRRGRARSSSVASPRRAGRRCSPRSPRRSPTSAGSWPTPRSCAASTACRPWSARASRPAHPHAASSIEVDGDKGVVRILEEARRHDGRSFAVDRRPAAPSGVPASAASSRSLAEMTEAGFQVPPGSASPPPRGGASWPTNALAERAREATRSVGPGRSRDGRAAQRRDGRGDRRGATAGRAGSRHQDCVRRSRRRSAKTTRRWPCARAVSPRTSRAPVSRASTTRSCGCPASRTSDSRTPLLGRHLRLRRCSPTARRGRRPRPTGMCVGIQQMVVAARRRA